MTRTLILSAALLVPLALPAAAHDRGFWPDRLEDRLDWVESRIDERFDRGPLDRIEDRWDRRESRRDRLNIKGDGPRCANRPRCHPHN